MFAEYMTICTMITFCDLSHQQLLLFNVCLVHSSTSIAVGAVDLCIYIL